MSTRARILTIDDETSIRHSIRAYLEDSGYDVEEAGDGPTGIAAIEKSPPDLVLCDLRMPGMHGLNVLQHIVETRPEILLLDDPCRGVDIGAKHEIYELMNRLCAQGVAIVLVSSEMPELLCMSDRIVVMHFGQVTLEMSRAEATQKKILYAALGGKE